MNTRIKYKEKDNLLVSCYPIRSEKTGARYIVKINPAEVSFKIINLSNGAIVVIGGEGVNNLHVLKRNIKSQLIRLGVRFKAEVRDRDFGVCEHGTTMKDRRAANNA